MTVCHYFGSFEFFEAIEYKINQFCTQISTLEVRNCNILETFGPKLARGLKSCCIPGVFIYRLGIVPLHLTAYWQKFRGLEEYRQSDNSVARNPYFGVKGGGGRVWTQFGSWLFSPSNNTSMENKQNFAIVL